MRRTGQTVLFFLTAAAAGTGVAYLLHKEPAPAPPPEISRRASPPASAVREPVTGRPVAAAPPLTSEERAAILTGISDMAVQYDAGQLPRLEAFLAHPDAEIRDAAAQGIVTLGEAAGAPLLRKAAQTAASPEEAGRFLKAAEYLELPPGSLLNPPSPEER